MLLNDFTIRKKIFEGDIEIEPHPEDICFQPASVDLTLGNEFKEYLFSNFRLNQWVNAKDESGKCILYPECTVLTHTAERIKLPNNLAARVEGRSSCGRKFLMVHCTAGFIDPGFNGQITLEVTNLGKEPLILKPGMKICQIVFEPLNEPALRPYGHPELDSKYQKQSGAQEGLR